LDTAVAPVIKPTPEPGVVAASVLCARVPDCRHCRWGGR